MSNAIIPIPRCEVSIRPATMDDLPFIDALTEEAIEASRLDADEDAGREDQRGACASLQKERTEDSRTDGLSGNTARRPTQSSALSPQSLGYCIGTDKYFKHDDIGIIYQLNVVAIASAKSGRGDVDSRRCSIGLLTGANSFAAGVRRTSKRIISGSRSGSFRWRFGRAVAKKARVHIFWQKRIREGDTTTPYWFPSQTSAGAIGEDRLVLPIPPGTHWSDAKPLILPGPSEEAKALPSPRARRERVKPAACLLKNPVAAGGLRMTALHRRRSRKPKAEKKPKLKNDPAHVAAARELRDRYLEQFNDASNGGLVLPGGKYEVTRRIEATAGGKPLLIEQAEAQAKAA